MLATASSRQLECWNATYSLGHTDTGIPDDQGLVLLVGDDVDAEVLAGIQLAGVGQGLISDLVQGIGGVGDEFSQEDLLVGVDGVDDQREQLRDLSLELEGFARHLEGFVTSSITGKVNSQRMRGSCMQIRRS